MKLSNNNSSGSLLALIREGRPMTTGQQLLLTAQLSVPAIMAQFSSIVMQYIDAAMVGSLGAAPAASIGLVSTTTWLFGGSCSAAATGFSVQVAHAFGAGDMKWARAILRQAFVAVLSFGLLLAAAGMAISGALPGWLGGDPQIRSDASLYFLIYSAFLPVLQLVILTGAMLRCSGNMHIPSLLSVLMCVLDVVFNYFLIFPTRDVSLGGLTVTMPGAGWGVAGAAVGTGLAEVVVAGLMALFLFASLLLWLLAAVLSWIPLLGWIFAAAVNAARVAAVCADIVLRVQMMLHAYRGEAYVLPVWGERLRAFE